MAQSWIRQRRLSRVRSRISALRPIRWKSSPPPTVLNQGNAEVSGVIEAEQIREIPLNGRNWATLMTLVPNCVNKRINL
jgi:hypothetical protein